MQNAAKTSSNQPFVATFPVSCRDAAGGVVAKIPQRIESRLSQLIERGELAAGEIEHIRNFSLPAASGTLDIPNELLERLRRTAQVWDVSLKNKEITSHRKVIGPVIVALKKMLFPIVHFFLADSLQQQRDFNASVIRCLVEMSRTADFSRKD